MLYSFTGGSDGRFPGAGLIFGKTGALYGTTEDKFTSDFGTVFQLTPPATGQTQWTETVLYRFGGFRDGNDGGYPVAGLIFGENGALYGTTAGGGTSNIGTVFQLMPPATGQTQWTETVLHSFTDGNDGATPLAGLTFGNNGALHGTTALGGPSNNGTVFRLTPPATGQTQWTETVLYSFTGGKDGGFPAAGLIFGENGALYGTTEGGVEGGFGTVFQLTPPATGHTQWTETVLYSFTGGNDGGNPRAGLIFGGFGALNGTTLSLETSESTVFKLRPPAAGQTAWRETVLHSFGATVNGFNPNAGLIFGAKGTLYGTTAFGGTSDRGTVFQLGGGS